MRLAKVPKGGGTADKATDNVQCFLVFGGQMLSAPPRPANVFGVYFGGHQRDFLNKMVSASVCRLKFRFVQSQISRSRSSGSRRCQMFRFLPSGTFTISESHKRVMSQIRSFRKWAVRNTWIPQARDIPNTSFSKVGGQKYLDPTST